MFRLQFICCPPVTRKNYDEFTLVSDASNFLLHNKSLGGNKFYFCFVVQFVILFKEEV